MAEILNIKNLTKSYDDLVVLDHVDLSVNQGEVVVIVGPSGCGKSTLLRCINAFEQIQEGEVTLHGERINPCRGKLNTVREKIGMVFQSYELFPHKTVLQNMTLAPVKVKKINKKDAEKEAEALLDRVGLLSKKNNYPHQLSGGMRQRAALLRTYMFSDSMALLDEPFSALDTITKSSIHEWYLDIMERINLSTIFITHDIDEAILLSDRIYILQGRPGRINGELRIEPPRRERAGFNLTEQFLEYKRSIIDQIRAQ